MSGCEEINISGAGTCFSVYISQSEFLLHNCCLAIFKITSVNAKCQIYPIQMQANMKLKYFYFISLLPIPQCLFFLIMFINATYLFDPFSLSLSFLSLSLICIYSLTCILFLFLPLNFLIFLLHFPFLKNKNVSNKQKM